MFWHQALRQTLGSPAHFATYHLLGLQRGGLAGRYMATLLGFTLSGVVHGVGGLAAGVPIVESGALQFFVVQTLGIMIEDAVQALWRCSQGTGTRVHRAGSTSGGRHRPALWQRTLGYVWFAAWMAWSAPITSVRSTPIIHCNSVLPSRKCFGRPMSDFQNLITIGPLSSIPHHSLYAYPLYAKTNGRPSIRQRGGARGRASCPGVRLSSFGDLWAWHINRGMDCVQALSYSTVDMRNVR